MTTISARIRAIPSWQVTLGVALLALGFLIAAQLAAEGPRVRYTTQERSPLVETALALQTQQNDLKGRIVALRDSIQTLEQQGPSASAVKDLNSSLREARIAAGLVALTGTGIVIKLEDSTQPPPPDGNPTDYLAGAADVRTVVGLLWQSGAEAISINDTERITTSTAIIDIGGSVLVNSAYLAGPYQINAIGPKDLFARLSANPGWEEFVRTRRGSFGIGISWAEPEAVTVPAFAGTVTLVESRAVASPSPVLPPSVSPSGHAGSPP